MVTYTYFRSKMIYCKLQFHRIINKVRNFLLTLVYENFSAPTTYTKTELKSFKKFEHNCQIQKSDMGSLHNLQ